MVVVGILSDTHGRLPAEAFAALADCDYLIHAGDIGDPEILRTLKTLAPTTAVMGNNDFNEYGETVQFCAQVLVGGVRFFVTHTPRDANIGRKGNLGLKPGDPIPHVCVHGHTHVPKILSGRDACPVDYVICPGSVIFPRGGSKRSVAKVIIEDGRVKRAFIEEI